MKYELKGDEILTEKGKVAANIVDGEIKPTAPVYYKAMEAFKALLGQEPESDLAEDQPSPEEVAEEIEEANNTFDRLNPPEMDPYQGDTTPGYPTWLHKTDPEQAAKQFKGRNIIEYETLIDEENDN